MIPELLTYFESPSLVPVLPSNGNRGHWFAAVAEARFLLYLEVGVLMTWQVGESYSIKYRSDSGAITLRTIRILSTKEWGATYLRAWCSLRGEERTFRTDRIIESTLLRKANRDLAPPVSLTGKMTESQTTNLASPPIPFARDFATKVPPSSSVPSKRIEHITFGDFLGKAIWFVICSSCFLSLLGAIGAFDLGGLVGETASKHWSNSTSLPSLYPQVAPFSPVATPQQITSGSTQPSAQNPVLVEERIGGRILRTVRAGDHDVFEVPDLGISTRYRDRAIAGIRIPAFEGSTGLTDKRLVARYFAADLDGSGKLSWDELLVFQKKTFAEFTYKADITDHRPSSFIHRGFGNCVDFSLYTAELLRFWGWEPYIACWESPGGDAGHALVFSYESGPVPAGFTSFELGLSWTADGSPLNAGRFVPIDYDHVGSLSSAIGTGWKFRELWTPENYR